MASINKSQLTNILVYDLGYGYYLDQLEEIGAIFRTRELITTFIIQRNVFTSMQHGYQSSILIPFLLYLQSPHCHTVLLVLWPLPDILLQKPDRVFHHSLAFP